MARKLSTQDELIQTIRDNYLSITLGILVLLIAASFVIKPQPGQQKSEKKSLIERIFNRGAEKMEGEAQPSSYTVKKGDHLWGIAQQRYGSGYNWVDIAQANKITNPDLIETGQTLTLPDVSAKQPTGGTIAPAATGKITITGDSYTVQKGDYLWSIAVRAYGDGYQWGQIARANNLINPNHIEVDQVLKLPRN